MSLLSKKRHTSSYSGGASEALSMTAVDAHSMHSALPSGSSPN
jgi:hypothetical protein